MQKLIIPDNLEWEISEDKVEAIFRIIEEMDD